MRYFTLWLLCLGITCGYMAHPAIAQDNSEFDNELFLRYLSDNQEYNDYLQEQLAQLFHLTFPQCETIEASKRLVPDIILTPAFRGDDVTAFVHNKANNFGDLNPTYGQWIDKTIVKGCNQTTQLNFLATSFSLFKRPVLHPTINGQTKIRVMDQEAAEKAVTAKLFSETGCTDSIFVMGSLVLGYKNPDSDEISSTDLNRGWYERWVIEACNTYHSVNLAILPDGKKRFEYIVQLTKGDNDSSPSAK